MAGAVHVLPREAPTVAADARRGCLQQERRDAEVAAEGLAEAAKPLAAHLPTGAAGDASGTGEAPCTCSAAAAREQVHAPPAVTLVAECTRRYELGEGRAGPAYRVVTVPCGSAVGGRVQAQRRGPLVVGLSVNNSYFRRPTTTALVAHLLERGHDVFPFVPHPPSTYTYRALGYKEADAQRKARHNGRRLQRWADDGARQVGGCARARYRPLGWAEPHKTGGGKPAPPQGWADVIAPHAAFRDGVAQVQEMYGRDAAFRRAVDGTTMAVVRAGRKDSSPLSDEQALAVGRNFLLQELAFLVRAHDVLGVPRDVDVAYVYHRRWPVFEDLLAGRFRHRGAPVTVPHLGFWCVELVEETEAQGKEV